MNLIPRSEHPRPDFMRENWLCLNGAWDFSWDTDDFDQTITVPFSYESPMSGIGQRDFHDLVWYRRNFTLPKEAVGKRTILHFGAVDYQCWVWVNGILVTTHEGGQSSFQTDITPALKAGENEIRVKAYDDHLDLSKPRGKQFWEAESRSIFYTRTTGIWQSVWLEFVAESHLESLLITPQLDEKTVRFDYVISGAAEASLEICITFSGKKVADLEVSGSRGSVTVNVDQPQLGAWNFVEDLTWSPENPRLFHVICRVREAGTVCDEVRSYFGMRKISVSNGKVLLNNRPCYQRLVLDQGYWPESLMTAPSDEAMVKDLELIKAMGFNGLRMHQKVEDPRFYYHADRLGLLVWAEYGAAYVYSREYAVRACREWTDCVLRDYNHPSIVAWVPLNESWGILEIKTDKMEQAHSQAMYALTKSLDPSRLVIDNDGWEHTFGDLLTIHDYEGKGAVLKERYEDPKTILEFSPGGRPMFADGWCYQNQPMLVTEFGGIRYAPGSESGWGYTSDETVEDFTRHLTEVVSALQSSKHIHGYCYTQFCDIETEENGLLTYDRQPKIPVETICAINQGRVHW